MRRHLILLLSGTLLVALVVAVAVVTPLATTAPAGAGQPGFVDVSPAHQFYGHITWMDEEGISTGYSDDTFRPAAVVSRGAMAAFLYRAAGEPAFPAPGEATFPDVRTDHPFFLEIEWLFSEGITEGFADGRFRPGIGTSRAAMAAYLYRFDGEPTFTDPLSPSFADVSLSHPFSHEIEWLVAQEITTGFGDDTFRPAAQVSRQAMSAFIFRVLHQNPSLTLDDEFVTGLFIPWDLAWTSEGRMLYTWREGEIWATDTNGGQGTQLVDESDPEMDDLGASGESGLMGLTLDPDFGTNRTFYTCQGEDQGNGGNAADNVQVVEWTVDAGYTAVTRVGEVIDMADWNGQPGRHAGCRLRFGADGHLWITAGDLACGTYPQNRNALAGKVLRIDEDAPSVAPADNPFVGDGNPATSDFVYTYGHRNPQGLALRPGTNQMWSVEHGSNVDDEVNLLAAGGNYGWHPVMNAAPCPNYDENVPMTDLAEFPNARPAVWDSNGATIATSGGTFLDGASWGGWDGAFVVAALNGQHARVLFLTESGVLIEQRIVEELDHTFGRLRTPQMGPSEDLFVATGNGGGDLIMRISATP